MVITLKFLPGSGPTVAKQDQQLEVGVHNMVGKPLKEHPTKSGDKRSTAQSFRPAPGIFMLLMKPLSPDRG